MSSRSHDADDAADYLSLMYELNEIGLRRALELRQRAKTPADALAPDHLRALGRVYRALYRTNLLAQAFAARARPARAGGAATRKPRVTRPDFDAQFRPR